MNFQHLLASHLDDHSSIVNSTSSFILPFASIGLDDIARVGGKNASLGEMVSKLSSLGIRVPDGFAISVDAYWKFISSNDLAPRITATLALLDRRNYSNLCEIGASIREEILQSTIPKWIEEAIAESYFALIEGKHSAAVAVRSSATAEDLPNASFAGQQETYLNVTGKDAVVGAVRKCYASLFTDRAIKYREDNSFDHTKVGLSVGIQLMIRADKGASGVAFTLDPDTGFDNAILITGTWGLGENIVGGVVTPDEFLLFKPSLRTGKRAIISKKLGSKEKMMVLGNAVSNHPGLQLWNEDTPEKLRNTFVLNDLQLEHLGNWLLAIEEHYGRPMDVEWAVDGLIDKLWILQARPEPVRSREKHLTITEYELIEEGILLTKGLGLGNKIVSGRARILTSPKQEYLLQEDEILVTDITSPD